MKTKQIFMSGIVSIALVFSLSSCKKDSSGSSSTLGFQIQALNKTVVLPVSGTKSAAVATSVVTWDTATLLVSRLRYEAEVRALASVEDTNRMGHHNHGFKKDSVKIEYKWEGPQTIDLFSINTFLGSFAFDPGFYNEIELYVQALKKDAGGKPVFYLGGDYTNAAGNKYHIVVSVSEDVMFKTEQDSVTVTAGANTDFTGVIQLYLDKLLTDVQVTNLDNATVTNGNILISAASNTELYRLILRNLRMDHHAMHERGRRHGH